MTTNLVKFISTTNPKFTNFAGVTGTLIYFAPGKVAFFDDLRTSTVKSIVINSNIITIATLNSIYKFEIIEETDNEKTH